MDNSSTTNGLPLFDGTNFANWKTRMLFYLGSLGLRYCVELPDNTDTSDTVFIRHDEKAQNAIARFISDEFLEYVRDCSSATEMWQELNKNFARQSIKGRIYYRRNWEMLSFDENDSLKHFFATFDSCAREYTAAGGTLSQEDRIERLLISMPESYESVINVIESIDSKDLTFNDVKSKLLEEEMKKKIRTSKASNFKSENSAGAAFYSNNNNYHPNKNTNKPDRIYCYNCGDPGHKSPQCPKPKKPKKFNNNNYNKKNNRNANVAERENDDNDDNYDRSFSLLGTVQTDNFCGSASDDLQFVIDSGCTDHIVNNRSSLVDIKKLDKPIEVSVAETGKAMTVTECGDLQIYSRVNEREIPGVFKNVLISPKARYNLLSVSRVEESGGEVKFKDGVAQISVNGIVVGQGKRIGRLYWINFEKRSSSCNSARSVSDEQMNRLWHRRLGHLNIQYVRKLKSMSTGLDKDLTDQLSSCDVCAQAKMTRLPFSGERKRADKPLARVHTDICGPITPAAIDGSRYFVTFIDDHTHMCVVFTMKNRSEVLQCLQKFYSMSTAHFNTKLSRLRCDNGGEYSSSVFKNYCEEKGIIIEYTVPYTPQLNGVAERFNRTLCEKVRAMLIDTNQPKVLWNEALLTANYLTNRSPTAAVKNKTPYELWFKRQPNLSRIKVFGSKAHVHIPKERQSGKFDSRTELCVLVGYAENGYRLWNPRTRSITVSRDVLFEENVSRQVSTLPNCDELDINNQTVYHNETTKPNVTVNQSDNQTIIRSGDVSAVPVAQSTPHTRTRTREVRLPARFNDYDVELHLALNAELNDDPNDYKDVAGRHDETEWRSAIADELNSMNENGTWIEVDRKPGMKAIGSRWVFRTKIDADGNTKCKARLVAKGYMQREGLDFNETYAPVARLPTIRLLLAVGLQHGFTFRHLDVTTAFLHGYIEEEVYLLPPDGVNVPPNKVLKLVKSIYGLKQAPKQWNERFHNFIITLGFVRSKSDYCLYTRIHNDTTTYLVVYVDDMLLCGDNEDVINEVISKLSSEFKMKNLGVPRQYMGLNINVGQSEGVITINQTDYINKVINKFKMNECNPISTPMEPGLKLEEVKDEQLADQYRNIIGSLMYLMLGTRPDICFAIGYLSRFQDKATTTHLKSLKRVLRYLKGTADFALTYRKTDAPLITGYVDADWANCSETRRSTSGYIFQVSGCPVIWSSRKQPIVTLSTTEAEFVAATTAAQEALWLQKVVTDLQLNPELPTIIYEDNYGALQVAKNLETKRSKHYDVKYHFLKELVWDGKLKLVYVDTKNQLADGLTKALPRVAHEKFVNQLSLERGGVKTTP